METTENENNINSNLALSILGLILKVAYFPSFWTMIHIYIHIYICEMRIQSVL
jgi:hypothetical protein